ncbi:calmodulin-binding transcription activator 2 isoform X1 [Rosa chinensis]|uniref:calmodulin-binding transcription activator 2 isoform X1 n=1 Tax=Rosa chinensis TaxID=74649 RepID=UPI001AD93202|nr:calmodulin-binding transcription activator 2 isoform X1 [Rosa chinensis]
MAESQRLLGGSLFLVDRKKVKHYKRDGHNWRKKKDGKTVMEGNEKLKVGHVHKLRCYYAPGEENKNFKRRIYSMLEEDLKHIVLVHYREEEVMLYSIISFNQDLCLGSKFIGLYAFIIHISRNVVLVMVIWLQYAIYVGKK